MIKVLSTFNLIIEFEVLLIDLGFLVEINIGLKYGNLGKIETFYF